MSCGAGREEQGRLTCGSDVHARFALVFRVMVDVLRYGGFPCARGSVDEGELGLESADAGSNR
eukprot:6997166-Pyramimonas_sp.AAC.1